MNITTHTQSICFENLGSHNVFERLVMRDNQAIGMRIAGGRDNLVLNCDAFRNWDFTSEDGTGRNVDGFGCHYAIGPGNVFRGCRAWFNSDDGFDCISAASAVTFDHCQAFDNGDSRTFQGLGDGNGFKAGGCDGSAVAGKGARSDGKTLDWAFVAGSARQVLEFTGVTGEVAISKVQVTSNP
ncbi:hypothetical protein Hsar01_03871 [Haloferula sargassicola]|uniref:Pel9A-like right handed beta-helix region domain-containing protein n=1 Tax=Haloferula sargassicola TaxID=490096 RepID=A0ABP9USW5_9BACT